jgi:transposase
MIRYQEILRLHSQGVSQRGIASSCQCSRNTVRKVLEKANEQVMSWPFKKEITDADLQELLFPEKNIQSSRKSPDCPYIHKEMAKNGVTLSLLWHEYCEQCRLSNEIPLMYSQFCRYYRKITASLLTPPKLQCASNANPGK